MTNRRWPSAIAAPAGLLCCVVLGCGWWSNSNDPDPNGVGETPVEKPFEPPPPPFRGWETPGAVLVVSGEQLGHLEPCGCAPETLAGGIARRHDLLEEIRERGWPMTAVDLGSTVRRARRQSAIKFETIHAAYEEMGYAAIGLGTREINLGPDYLLAQGSSAAESETGVPLVSANVTLFGVPDLPGGPVPLVTKQVGDATVAITSVVVDSKTSPEIISLRDTELGDAEEALRAVAPKIEEAEANVNVLLAHAREKEARRLAEAFPLFDVVVCTGPEEPASEPVLVGETMLIQVGEKGKYVGVVGWFPEADVPLRYELVHLDRHRFDETAAMHDRMAAYQKRLFEERVPALGEPATHPRQTHYVGAKACGECHQNAYAKWSTSRHSHAFESLAKGHDPEHGDYPESEHDWIDRSFDPECLVCHVTGWDPENVLRYEGGFLNEAFATTDDEKKLEALLGAQQCENCHGPAGDHAEIEWTYKDDPTSIDEKKVEEARAAVRLMVVKDPVTGQPQKAVRNEGDDNLCKKCHDADNSPKFDFPSYWEKVKHPGKP